MYAQGQRAATQMIWGAEHKQNGLRASTQYFKAIEHVTLRRSLALRVHSSASLKDGG
jgi:hypothetical protein